MNLYADVRHANFWWGFFGFAQHTSWEDILLYKRKFFFYQKIASFSVNSRSFIDRSINAEEEKLSEPDTEFDQKVQGFLKSQKIEYHYYYSTPDEDPDEVPYDAPTNDYGTKPCYIELWHPSDGIGIKEAEECIRVFADRFLHIAVSKIKWKAIPTLQHSLKEFLSEQETLKDAKMVFSSDIVTTIAEKCEKSKDHVQRIIKQSAGTGAIVEFRDESEKKA